MGGECWGAGVCALAEGESNSSQLLGERRGPAPSFTAWAGGLTTDGLPSLPCSLPGQHRPCGQGQGQVACR